MVTEINVQDLDSHSHIEPVLPTWSFICQLMGRPDTTTDEDVMDEYTRALDQYEWELKEWHARNQPIIWGLAA